MTITIRGVPFSTCTQRVLTVCKELDIPYEIQPVDFSVAEHKSPAFLEHQPFGQIPYIIDGSFELFESRAIARYLATKFARPGKPSLLPITTPGDAASLERNAKFEQAASVEASNFDPFASGIAIEKVFKPMRGLQEDPSRTAEHLKTLEAKLKGYEAILSKQKYLAGDEVTLADLFHLPYGHILTEKLGINLLTSPDTPNVARWWQDISTRDSWVSIQNDLRK